MHRALPTGVYKTPTGYRAFIRLSPDRLASARFGPDTPIAAIKQWREAQRVDYRRRQTIISPAPSEGFTKDAETYLKAVVGMASYSDRKRDIDWWVGIFGERPREGIQSHEIAAALATLKGSASSHNHKRTALAHLWRTLDGKAARNPVREVPKRREPDAEPRGLPYATIRKILDAMPESATKARLMVMAWTGIPPAQLKKVTPADIEPGRVYVRGRAKGHGTKGRWVPLSPEGVRAFKAFVRADAFGPFSRSSMHSSFRRACEKVDKVKLIGVRPYDLRHSFGTDVYAASGDPRATQILMGHSKPEMTHRYTLGAVDEQVEKALRAFAVRTKKKTRKR